MRRIKAAFHPLAALVVLLPCAVVAQSAGAPAADGAAVATAPPSAPTAAERGKYLADAGNCFSCHTQRGAVPFSGGLPFDTPFGKIYSTNITPDAETGIGKWTVNDLRSAMHEGKGAGGFRIFPAFPYTSFTKVTDADVADLYAYLRTLKPARYKPPGNGLLFSMRWPLMIWNALFFEDGRYQANPAQSAEWNRGAYLVEGLGHCSACHTPRNTFMAEQSARAYEGGFITDKVAKDRNRRWSAINLTSAKHGLASWSVADLTRYLHTGFSSRAGTFGPMNEVIVNSLRNLKAEDVKAMAVYLKSLPAREYTGETVTPELAKAGESIYKDRCEKCHSASGRGGLFSGPPVAGSAIVQAEDPASLVNIILYGPETPESVNLGAWETMPSYSDVLSDAQVVAVSNYMRGSWENRGRPLTGKDVTSQR